MFVDSLKGGYCQLLISETKWRVNKVEKRFECIELLVQLNATKRVGVLSAAPRRVIGVRVGFFYLEFSNKKAKIAIYCWSIFREGVALRHLSNSRYAHHLNLANVTSLK